MFKTIRSIMLGKFGTLYKEFSLDSQGGLFAGVPSISNEIADVAIASGNSATILAANTARKSCMIRVASSSAGSLRLSSAANKGVSVDAGGYVIQEGTFEIVGYALNGNITLEINEFE